MIIALQLFVLRFPEQWVTKKNLKPNRRRVSLSQVSPAVKEKVEDFIFGKKEKVVEKSSKIDLGNNSLQNLSNVLKE